MNQQSPQSGRQTDLFSILPELAGLRLLPFQTVNHCPKCRHGRVRLPVFLIRILELPFAHFDMAYCRGGMPVAIEHDMGSFGKHEDRPRCAGVTEEHIHVRCSRCGYNWLMQVADEQAGVDTPEGR